MPDWVSFVTADIDQDLFSFIFSMNTHYHTPTGKLKYFENKPIYNTASDEANRLKSGKNP